jgi:hypothetical protein
MKTIPRNEHPRPDRMRDCWLNLNGLWDFEIDNAMIGVYKEYYKRDSLDMQINIPFCPESVLSGVGNTDFMNAVWYRRDIDIPSDWLEKRIILHIDASDYDTTVYVNGLRVGDHKGGYTSFEFDITKYLKPEGNYLTVYVVDDTRSYSQLSGKQSTELYSSGCHYTRTTGIWQTVWLEAVEDAYVKSYKTYANISDPSVSLEIITSENSIGGSLEVEAFYEGKFMGKASADVNSLSTNVKIDLAEKHFSEVCFFSGITFALPDFFQHLKCFRTGDPDHCNSAADGTGGGCDCIDCIHTIFL